MCREKREFCCKDTFPSAQRLLIEDGVLLVLAGGLYHKKARCYPTVLVLADNDDPQAQTVRSTSGCQE